MNGIVFRRIHGRIIPIKKKVDSLGKKDVIEIAKGAGYAAAGVGVAASGGRAFAKTVLSSAKMAFRATDFIHNVTSHQPSLFTGDLARSVAKGKAEKLLKHAVTRSRIAAMIRIAAPIAGTALFAYGANRIAKALKENKKDLSPAAIGAAAASVAGASFYYGQYGRLGAKEALRHYGIPAIQKIKSLIKVL